MTAALADPVRPRPVLELVDPAVPDDALSIDELGSRIVGLAGRLAAATCRLLLLIAQFDRREGFAQLGLPTAARWLSHCCGLSHRTAVEHVRVARALAALPALAEGMGAGELSYSQVRAISRIAHEGEHELIADLIVVARHGSAAQLETMVRGLRTVEATEAPGGPQRPEEYLSQSWSPESQWRCHARLDPERGAVVRHAIETIARAEGVSQADALVRMAEVALAALNDSGTPPRGLRGDERAAVVIHLDAAAVSPPPDDRGDAPRSAERGRPFARLAGGPGLPPDVVERLLCAGRIRTAVHEKSGNVRDLGRSHQSGGPLPAAPPRPPRGEFRIVSLGGGRFRSSARTATNWNSTSIPDGSSIGPARSTQSTPGSPTTLPTPAGRVSDLIVRGRWPYWPNAASVRVWKAVPLRRWGAGPTDRPAVTRW